jgi:hypothetical protein
MEVVGVVWIVCEMKNVGYNVGIRYRIYCYVPRNAYIVWYRFVAEVVIG